MKGIIIIITLILLSFLVADEANGWKALHEAVYKNDMDFVKRIVIRYVPVYMENAKNM
jgi:hypothetical protein